MTDITDRIEEQSNKAIIEDFRVLVDFIGAMKDNEFHQNANYAALGDMRYKICFVKATDNARFRNPEMSLADFIDKTIDNTSFYQQSEMGFLNRAMLRAAAARIWSNNGHSRIISCSDMLINELSLEGPYRKERAVKRALLDLEYKDTLDVIERELGNPVGIRKTFVDSYISETERLVNERIYEIDEGVRPLIVIDEVHRSLEEFDKYGKFLDHIPEIEIGYHPSDPASKRGAAIDHLKYNKGLNFQQMIRNGYFISTKPAPLLGLLEWAFYNEPDSNVKVSAQLAYERLTDKLLSDRLLS